MPDPNQTRSLPLSPDANPQNTLAVNVHPANGDEPYRLADLPQWDNRAFKIGATALFDLIGDVQATDEIVFEVVPTSVFAFADGRVLVNEAEHTVTVDGVLRNVGARGFDVLRMLARRPDTALSWELIAEEVWPNSPERFERQRDNIQVHIGRIRSILGPELRSAIRTYRPYRYSALSSLLGELTVPESGPPDFSFADGRIQLYEENHTVIVDDSPRDFSLKPYQVLRVLAESAGTVVSYRRIAEEVWEARTPEEFARWRKNLCIYMSRIRTLLGPELRRAVLTTQPGPGYCALHSLADIKKYSYPQ